MMVSMIGSDLIISDNSTPSRKFGWGGSSEDLFYHVSEFHKGLRPCENGTAQAQGLCVWVFISDNEPDGPSISFTFPPTLLH